MDAPTNANQDQKQALLSICPDEQLYTNQINSNFPNQQEVIFSENDRNYNSPCPIFPIIVDNNLHNNCNHLPLELEVKISQCETCVCCLCCALGFVMLILGLFIASKANNSGSSSNNIRPSLGPILWNTHWLYNYGYSRNFIEERISCNRSCSEIELGCFGMKYPHDYKIFCKDCGYVLKEGHNSGNTAEAVVFGIFGLLVCIGVIIYVCLDNKDS